jgi:prolipoprotein diacylglyceryltransferase
MNGIIININPVALQIGYFELRWYSIFVVLGSWLKPPRSAWWWFTL